DRGRHPEGAREAEATVTTQFALWFLVGAGLMIVILVAQWLIAYKCPHCHSTDTRQLWVPMAGGTEHERRCLACGSYFQVGA
ncbi:MAG: hypothetical protein ACR2P5_05980, partial [Gammaproteobacteria bacterium]